MHAYYNYLAQEDWQSFGALFDPDFISQVESLWRTILAYSSPEEQTEVLEMFFGPGTTTDDFEAMDGVTIFAGLMDLMWNQSPGVNRALAPYKST